MAQTGVKFAGVSYALPDGRMLLTNIDLRLEAGTVTALLGRSGSGKTTLLRMVNGLVMPTAGSVLVGGKPTTDYDLRELRRSVGYVIQETGLFPHMTVERNAGLALEVAGLSGPDKQRRTAEVLALAGLDSHDFGARYPWQLSGGQRQRVGLARALATDPGVLLMDEPFGALDPLTRAEMQTMLLDLLARVGKTVLLVTHDLDEALYLAQRVIFLETGEVVADLPAAEVLQSQNEHVRNYVNAVHRPPPDSLKGTASAVP
ncbi:MAG TPA: ATP-binding cassette domain-containing protein [Acidobacteriaceae bacterium]